MLAAAAGPAPLPGSVQTVWAPPGTAEAWMAGHLDRLQSRSRRPVLVVGGAAADAGATRPPEGVERWTVAELAGWLVDLAGDRRADGGGRDRRADGGGGVVHPTLAALRLQEQAREMVDELLCADESEPRRRAVTLAVAAGMELGELDLLALQLLHRPWADSGPDPAGGGLLVDVSPLVTALEELVACASWCDDPDDRLLRHLQGPLAEAAVQLRAGGHNPIAAVQLLAGLPSFACTGGRRQRWGGRAQELRLACRQAQRRREGLLQAARHRATAAVSEALGDAARRAEARRRQDGALTVADALVLGRSALARDPVRRLVAEAFGAVMVIGAGVPAGAEMPGAAAPARAGLTGVVGVDPDELPGAASALLAGLLAELAEVVGDVTLVADPDVWPAGWRRPGDRWLHEEHRSAPGLVALRQALAEAADAPQVCDVLEAAGLLEAAGATPADGPPGRGGRPSLVARRPLPVLPGAVQLRFDGMGGTPVVPASGGGRTPAVTVLLGAATELGPGALVRRSAAAVAGAVQAAVGDGWPVQAAERTRPARWSDVAVVAPTVAGVLHLHEALAAAEIPVRLEGRALWQSPEVRDLLVVVRAADDPADAVAVVAALRTPGLGCGDDDLLRWHQIGGSWDPTAAPPPGAADEPVARGLHVLGELHRLRWWSEPAAVVEAAVTATQALALAEAEPEPEEARRRVRFAALAARRFEEVGGVGTDLLLRWAELCAADGSPALHLADGSAGAADTVRLSTVHDGVGRPAPVVVLGGLEQEDPVPSGPVAAGAGVEAGDFGPSEPEPVASRQRSLRLALQAAGLARDHLVVALHRREPHDGGEAGAAQHLAQVMDAVPNLWRRLGRQRVMSRPLAETAAEPRGKRP